MKNKGKIGEDQAVEFLKKNQFSICMRNFTTRFGELDIIAKKNERFHIKEVKYQTNPIIDSLFKINPRKRKRMIKCTQIYMKIKKTYHYFYQFDLIAINRGRLTHFENVFNLSDV
jgi:putative endonuclease